MSRLTLNKSSLHREAARLNTYRRFLPSLELKRQQLIAERGKAIERVQASAAEQNDLRDAVTKNLPMLSNRQIDLDGLVDIRSVELTEENLVGVILPVFTAADIEIRSYSFMAKPHWVDEALQCVKKMLVLRVRSQVEQERCRRLEAAVRKITQRVNLFEKVLIPRTQSRIKTIKIYLSDQERAGVVRAKIAKAKRAAEARS